MHVRWLRHALRNLDEEASYIAQEDPQAAQQVVQRVLDSVAMLVDQPGIGRPGRVPGTRELSCSGHAISSRIGCGVKPSRSYAFSTRLVGSLLAGSDPGQRAQRPHQHRLEVVDVGFGRPVMTTSSRLRPTDEIASQSESAIRASCESTIAQLR